MDEDEILELKDGAGNPVVMVTAEGTSTFKSLAEKIYYPHRSYKQQLKDIKALQLKPDDVLIIAYFKSGTHWIWEIVSLLLKGKAEYETKVKESAMIDHRSISSEIDKLPSPRILNTHHPTHLLPSGARAGQCKLIHVLRNPRDVGVSWYHHIKRLDDFNGTFSDYLPLFLGENGQCIGYSWFQYEREYEQLKLDNPDLPIHTVSYEDMKKNFQAEAKRLADFLEVSYDDQLLADIEEKCQFQNHKRANAEIKKDQRRDGLYRKGEIGDWKNWFSSAELELIDKVYKQRMNGSSLKFDYT